MKHIFFLAAFLCLFSFGILSAQETDVVEENSAAPEESTVVDADNPGMGLLDQATEAKLRASAVPDLSQVIVLCRQAKKAGLSGDNLHYCNQLLASTQLQRGLFLAQSLLNPQSVRPRDWMIIRQRTLVDLEEAVAIIKDQPTAYLRIAQLNLLPEGDENRAKEVLKLAVQCSKDEPTLQLQAIRTLSLLEPAPEERERILADAAKDGSTEVKLLYALTLDELKRTDESLAVLLKLIETESDNVELQDRIVATLTGLGKHDSVMKILDQMSKTATDERVDRVNLMKAELFFKMEQDDEALSLLNALDKKLRGSTSLKIDTLRMRSNVYLTMDDLENALKDIETAERLRPDFLPVMQQKYTILMAQKNFEEALEIVKKMQSLDSEDVSNTLREIQVLTSQEKYDEALKITMRLQEQFPKEPQWILLLIEIYSKQNSYDKALALVEEQLKENPDEIRWIVLKSQLFTEQKKWDEAINWLKSCLQKKPEAQEINLILVSVLADSKKYEEAKERIKPLLEKEPENLLLLRLDSQISISMGRHSDAIKTLRKVIELDPKDYTSINNLSWIFSTSPIDSVRNGQQALELAEKACELSLYKKAFVLSTLAAAHAELGNFDKAREWSQKSIDQAKKEKGQSEEEQKELLDNLQKELDTFKKDEPYREYIDIEEK